MPAAIRDSTGEDADSVRVTYLRAMSALAGAHLPYLVGGTHALSHYTGIERTSKDFDVFVRREDFDRVMVALDSAGFATELTYPHWLGKAHGPDAFVDVIFSSGNGISAVDDAWFEHAAEGTAFGIPVKLVPAEEIIWSKAYIMERERFDGADVMHLFLARAEKLDWARLVRRFGPHWRVLFAHLCLFGFMYPSERNRIPAWIMAGLMGRLDHEMRVEPPSERITHGTLVSREQYLVDMDIWGFKDARLTEVSAMTLDDIEQWTRAIPDKK
jgi:hypothetical protein